MATKETIKLSYKRKIFTQKDIESLADIFIEFANEINKDDYIYSKNFIVRCQDDTIYEDFDVALFAEKSNQMKKKVKSISMELRTKNNSLDLRLYTPYLCEVTIRSNDNRWISLCKKKIEDAFNVIEDQHLLSKFLPYILTIFLWTVIQISIPRKIFNDVNKDNITYWGLYLIAIVLCGLLSAYFMGAWPSIEFQFGGEHLHLAKKKRRIIFGVFSTAGLPILKKFLHI